MAGHGEYKFSAILFTTVIRHSVRRASVFNGRKEGGTERHQCKLMVPHRHLATSVIVYWFSVYRAFLYNHDTVPIMI